MVIEIEKNKEELPTKNIDEFVKDLVSVLKDKFEIQNSKISKLTTDINLIKQNDISSIKENIASLDEKIKELEKKIEEGSDAKVNKKILDELKRC
ncbi:MAG: hypothetical protein B6U88_01600 [Candidatus Aenigmarchaeota archaeon ex4484_56]|nr:MAG: hypothetical protein B6U88_01600 [Candidatus Aenigmarchaeota archaeon ex4484_56]